MAQIWHCCGCGVRPAATALIRPLDCEPPHAAGAALKAKKKNEQNLSKMLKIKRENAQKCEASNVLLLNLGDGYKFAPLKTENSTYCTY